MVEVDKILIKRRTINGDCFVLNDVSLNFKDRVNVIYGIPGSGKTTLFETIAGIEKPISGSIRKNGNIIFLMQVPERQFIYASCLMEICCGKYCNEEVGKMLSSVGLTEDIRELSPWSLSKGERKRLVLARILKHDISIKERNIFLLDDPFGDMDIKGKRLIINSIIKDNNFKVIMATSNREDLRYLEDEEIKFSLINLERGRVVN